MPLFLAPLETKIRIAKILTDEKTEEISRTLEERKRA